MSPLQSGKIAERENAVTITTGSQFFLQYIITEKYCEEKVNILESPEKIGVSNKEIQVRLFAPVISYKNNWIKTNRCLRLFIFEIVMMGEGIHVMLKNDNKL